MVAERGYFQIINILIHTKSNSDATTRLSRRVNTFSFPSSLREQLALNFVLAPYEGLERHHQHGGAYEKPGELIDGLVSWGRS
jgi:hypothetical protein